MEENKKPKIFLVTKIIGLIGVAVGIAGIVLTARGFGNFENNNFMIGGIMVSLGFFVGLSCLFYGFSPEIAKLRARNAKYIQEMNKEEYSDILSNSADIRSEEISKVVKTVKKEIKDTIFCTDCGEEIDRDSKFCNHCGKKQ